jgi:hypothetical protein
LNGPRTTASLTGARNSLQQPAIQKEETAQVRIIRGDFMLFRLCRAVLTAAFVTSVATIAIHAHCQSTGDETTIRINQIQVIGTHNSYHAGIAPNEATLWQQKYAEAYKGLDYQHQPLPQQFDSGVRQIELDVYADSRGGLYAHPRGPMMVAAAHLPPDPDFDPDGVMLKPGFKVMHVQDVDYRSTCQPFTGCLQQIRQWSQGHRNHIPIFILIETKQGKPSGELHLTEPEPFTSATFDALDAEIRSVFPPDEIITPDGRVIFLMDQRPVGPVYLDGHPSLRGRVIFTNSEPGRPDAAFIEQNDDPAAEISALVRQGYLIRTRTDSDTKEARVNDTTRRNAVIASGAQLLSTDYPVNEPARWPGHFVVTLPGNAVARCNPINTPASCSADALK